MLLPYSPKYSFATQSKTIFASPLWKDFTNLFPQKSVIPPQSNFATLLTNMFYHPTLKYFGHPIPNIFFTIWTSKIFAIAPM